MIIRLKISSEEALAYIEKIGAKLADLSVPIRQVLESALSDAYLEVTASKGSLFGSEWRPMTHFTAWFHKRDPSTLMDSTGQLAGSLTPGGAGNIMLVGPLYGETGTTVRHAGWQQRGTSRTFRVLQFLRHGVRGFNVPGITPRPFLEWHFENFDKYGQMFAVYLKEIER